MATTKTERSSPQPEHQVTGRRYPGEWARQIELYLDKEPRRLVFYGGLFGVFVLAVVISLIIGLVS
jgi:hypothetical protein